MTASSPFKGRWRVTKTDVWDRKGLDLVEPAHIVFAGRLGQFMMIAVEGYLDCRYDDDRVEFSWVGNDSCLGTRVGRDHESRNPEGEDVLPRWR